MIESLDGQVLIVLDTKYKRLDPTQRRLGVDQGDVYQMLAYAQRLDCPRLLLLYPQTVGSHSVPILFDFVGSPVRLVVAAIDLHQPLDQIEPLLHELSAILRYAVTDQRASPRAI